MTDFCLQVILAYMLGSISGSLLIGGWRGVDVRDFGSGNAGATNALRTQGKSFALAVLGLDILKGVLAVALLPKLSVISTVAVVPEHWPELACGFAVTLGHVFPIFFGFRGGRGAATLLGVFLVLIPQAVPAGLAAFVAVLVGTGMVSLATLVGAAAITGYAFMIQDGYSLGALTIFSLLTFALILTTHRENLRRIAQGTESRFKQVMIFHRLLGR